MGKKTTIVLPPSLASELKREAALRGTSMSEIVQRALRHFFHGESTERKKVELPIAPECRLLVDINGLSNSELMELVEKLEREDDGE